MTKEVRVEETVGGVEYDGDDQDVERGRLEVDLGPTEHPEEDGGDHHPCDDQTAGLRDDDEDLPDDHHTKAEMKEMETMFMGTESEARMRFQKNGADRPRSRLRFLS